MAAPLPLLGSAAILLVWPLRVWPGLLRPWTVLLSWACLRSRHLLVGLKQAQFELQGAAAGGLGWGETASGRASWGRFFLYSLIMTRRFPPPWTVEEIPGGFKVIDAKGQSLAYCYGRETQADADIAKVLTMDNARRIAANIAKLPEC